MNLKHAALAVALLCLTIGPASPIGFGEMGQHFGKEGADIIPNSGGGGATNFLLSNTGSVLLVNTGVKFLIQ